MHVHVEVVAQLVLLLFFCSSIVILSFFLFQFCYAVVFVQALLFCGFLFQCYSAVLFKYCYSAVFVQVLLFYSFLFQYC